MSNIGWGNWPSSISLNAPFRTEMCTFLFWMEHCGISNRCILGFVKLLFWYFVQAKVTYHQLCQNTHTCPLIQISLIGKISFLKWHLFYRLTSESDTTVMSKWLFQVMCLRWLMIYQNINYLQTSNISRTSVGNKIVENSDVVGALPVGTAPTTSSFST